MSILKNLNAAGAEELIGTAILSIKKQVGREEFQKGYESALEHIEKLPEDKSLTIAKVNGKITLFLADIEDLEFEKDPIIVSLQEIVEDNL